MSVIDLFPDCRPKAKKGGKYDAANGVWWYPVACASCHQEGAMAPETSTHVFYLCDPCFKKHGHLTGVMMVPDAVYYQKVAEEQMEAHGRYLTPDEMAKVREDNDTPLARLLLEAP